MKAVVIGHAYTAAYNRADKLTHIAMNPYLEELTVVIPHPWVDRMMQVDRSYYATDDDNLYEVALARPLFKGSQQRHIFSPFRLNHIIQNAKPDIIHIEQEVHDWVAAEIVWLNEMLWHKPVVLFGWENIARSFDFVTNRMQKMVLQNLDHYIAGNGEAASIVRKNGYQGPVTIMPQFGVDEKRFRPMDVRERRNSLGLDDAFVIGFVGRLVEEKGIGTLLTALEQVIKDNTQQQVLLLLLSSMDPPDWVHEQITKLGDNVKILSAVPHDDFPEYMNTFDVLVLPSETTLEWKEQFGRVMIEAMACGVPVIGSSSGAIPEVISNSRLIFPEKNPQALAHCIEDLMNDPSWQTELSDSLRERVLSEYTHEKIANKTVALWEEILTQQK